MECKIPVNDIARTNMVIGIGTTLHKVWVNGEAIYLPCLPYHLPSAEVQLFSPQTYHKLYGGHSSVFGDRVVKMIDNLALEVDIDQAGGNVPMVHKPACIAKEIEEIGPHMRSALHQYERKTDLLGGWSTSDFSNWGVDSKPLDKDDASFGLRNVLVDENRNLTNP